MVEFENAALLVMDFQTQILESIPDHAAARVLEGVGGAVEAARARGLPVIFVKVQYRSGYPDVSERNMRVAMLRDQGMLNVDDSKSEIDERLDVRDGDPIIVKRRVSALAHTDLIPLVNGLGVDTLLLAGVTTSGAVLSTVRQAADWDFRLVVLEDCCADRDEEMETVLMEKIFPTQATVIRSTDLRENLD